MSINYYRQKEMGFEYDKDILIDILIQTYKTTDETEMEVKLKADLSKRLFLINMLKRTKFEKEDLVLHIHDLFPNLLTKPLIKRIRKEMRFIYESDYT